MRRLFWPALTTTMMLSITLSLGVWQLQRQQWKQALLAEIDRGALSEPQPLSGAPVDFQRVRITGRFLPGVARYGAELGTTREGAQMGAHLLSPLERADGLPVIVDRGWAPMAFDASPPAGAVTVEGYVRPPERPVRFGPTDDPVGRRFFALDPAAIGASLGLAQVAPFTLVVLGKPGALPQPATALPRPPNDHLSYAITWFALSVVLVGVFAAYARQVLRKQKAP